MRTGARRAEAPPRMPSRISDVFTAAEHRTIARAARRSFHLTSVVASSGDFARATRSGHFLPQSSLRHPCAAPRVRRRFEHVGPFRAIHALPVPNRLHDPTRCASIDHLNFAALSPAPTDRLAGGA
jgi:hypothetical protein